MNTKEQLIKHLEENTRVLRTPEIKNAFKQIDRLDFVNPQYKDEAYEDYPLPIGFGQTISQPTTVAFMLELLDVKPENKILDIGSGSGFTTALLAKLAPRGEVQGIELIPELAEMGKKNLSKYKLHNARIDQGDFRQVISKNKKFDRILVSAASDEMPEGLIDSLAERGVLVIPIKNSIIKIRKNKTGDIESSEYPGFSFVELK